LAGGEGVTAWAFFVGTSIPTGDQTVTVTVDGADTTSLRSGCAITLTAAADTEVVDSDGTINSTSATNPSVTLSLGGATAWAGIALASGANNPPDITPLTDWTSVAETDFGSSSGGVYRYDTVAATDVTCGWTQAADDAAAVCVAVKESAGAPPATPTGAMLLMGVGT
jgi:hypothetical protein